MTIGDDGFPREEQGSEGASSSFTQEDFDKLVIPEVRRPSPITQVLDALYDTIIPSPEVPDIPFSKELWNDFYSNQPGSFIAMSLNSELWGSVIERANKNREDVGQKRQLDPSKLLDLTRLHFAPV